MSEQKLQEAMRLALENAEYIGRLKAQNECLQLVWALHEQDRISDEVAQVFAMELSLDLP